MISAWWAWVRRALTSPEALATILGRYDWPESHWSPSSEAQPPSVEAVADAVARVRIPGKMERQLMRRHRWQLWALVDAREADLPALYEAVRRHEWAPYSQRKWQHVSEYVQVQVSPVSPTVDDVARLILEPQCTEAMRLMVLRGWGTRLWEVVRGRHG